MIKTRICPECERVLSLVVTALRQHEGDIHTGLKLNLEGRLTEESRLMLAPEAVESFNATRVAWDAYCRHLDEHGLLKPALQGKTAD
jgi:hypothetical protein